jgi:4-amino-4-deoxy-L-arabinose transferase-like glycosyltransferase
MDLRVAAVIALVSAAFLFTGLGRYGVVNADEAIYHGVAERMVETGELHRLDFRGERRVYDTFMNAPLHYWARAGLIAMLGSSLFTMRAVSALSGVLAVLATYALGCRLVGRRAALLAAAVQLTTFQFVYLHGARTGELDAIATCLVVVCCLCFLRGVENGRSFAPHHLALTALAMTKLPLVILPLTAELVWLALHPGERSQLRRYLTTGALLAPLALLWHGSQAFLERDQLGNILETMAGQASGDRDATGRPADGPRLGPIGNARFYASAVLYGAFPWAATYPFAIAAAFTRGAAGRRTALVFAATVWVFFVFVSKHYPWYVMPAYPFLSILVGAWLLDLVRRDAPAWTGFGLGFVLAACLWLGVDVFGTNPFEKRALVFPMQTTARGWLGSGPLAAVLILGVVWAGAWLAGARGLPERLRVGLGAAAAVGLLSFAALRVTAPFAYLDHQSPLQQIRAEIDRAVATGTPLRYPIPLGRPPVKIARFLFAEDFEIVNRLTADGGSELVLHSKGNPRVLERSIGRVGLEWRFEQARERELGEEAEAP